MAALVLGNNAYSTLGANALIGATSLTLATGTGTRFPTITGSDYMYLTLQDGSNNIEIVKCTAHAASADTLTVTRGQDGTAARAWSLGDAIELRVTAAVLTALTSTGLQGTTVLVGDGAGGIAAAAETGSGAVVRATSPTLTTPNIGTPSAGVVTNLTGTGKNITAGLSAFAMFQQLGGL